MTTKTSVMKQATVKNANYKDPKAKILTPEENKTKTAELLKQLKAAILTSEKKALRRKLRALGHTGGLKAKP